MTSATRASSPGPHDNTVPRKWGAPFTSSMSCIVIFLHGRASSPEEDMPVFEPVFEKVDAGRGRIGAIALRAQDEVWFPEDWAAPIHTQEPYASNALALLHRTIEELPIPASRVIIIGFSQGAALALTYALSKPQRLGGIAALSGHMIGSPTDWPVGEGESLEGTTCYVAFGSQDKYIKENRTIEDVKALGERGGKVELRIFEGMGHFVTQAEVDRIEAMVREVDEMV